MRVGIVAPPWIPVPPPAYGGTEAVLDTLARGLQDAGHDVLLFASGDSSCPVPIASVFAEAVGAGAGGSAAELCHVVHAYRAMAAFGADVVHDHTLVGPFYAQTLPGVAVVTTCHGPFMSDLGDVYRALGERVPIIAISDHHACTPGDVPIAAVIHHSVAPMSTRWATGVAATPRSLVSCTPTKVLTWPAGWHGQPGCHCASPRRCASPASSPGSLTR